MSSQKQKKANITEHVMQRNWTLLKQININDIIDKMIEQFLISIEKGKEFKEKETQSQQTEALLYEVYRKPQPYLHAFFTILAETGYDFIVKILQEDADTEATDQLNPSLEKFSGCDNRPPHVTHQELSDAVPPETDTASGGMETDEMRATTRREIEELQSEHEEKLTLVLMKQVEESLENQTLVLTKQVEEVLEKKMQVQAKQQSEQAEKQTQELKKQQSEQIEKQTQILMANIEREMQTQVSKLRQKEINQKANELKIKTLESKLTSLQTKLEKERAKTKTDLTKANEKIKQLQTQKEQLQHELALAKKEYSESLTKQDRAILKTLTNDSDALKKGHRNQNQEKSDQDQASSRPKPINPFLSPRAKQVEGVPMKKT